MPQSSVYKIIDRLKEEYASSPFLALGQTVLWDEPVKASWRAILDQLWPDANIIAAIHDTDYFAKTNALASSDESYAIAEHNDGQTRDLWSAAGEISSLFGSEDIPTRRVFESHNVPISELASNHPAGKAAFYNDKTAAWGWTGLVHTGSKPPIARDVPIREIEAALIEQLKRSFQGALCIIDLEDREASQKFTDQVLGWVNEFIENARPNASLSDLYVCLLPKFYEALLGCPAKNLTIGRSTDLFRFNTKTFHLPRFSFIQLFLDPKNRNTAISAYNSSVAGGGMYGLESFGEGAGNFESAT